MAEEAAEQAAGATARAGVLPRDRAGRLLVAYALVALAVLTDNGSGPIGLPLVLGAAWLVVRELRRSDGRDEDPARARRLRVWLVVVLGALAFLRPPAQELQDPAALVPLWASMLALLAATIAAFETDEGRPGRPPGWAWAALLVLVYLGAGAVAMRASPRPQIDVFVLQQGGAAALAQRQDPYSVHYANPYDAADTRSYYGDDRKVLDAYPYPPPSLLMSSAAWAVAGDVRWASLIAQLLIGLGLYVLARRSGRAAGEAAGLLGLHLLHPRGLFVLEHGWTEPIVGAVFVGALLVLPAASRGRAFGPGLVLGLLLTVKQYLVVAVPLLWSPRVGFPRRTWPFAAVAAAALIVPFVVWDPRGFLDDVVLFQLRQPWRADALSVPGLILLATGWRVPSAITPLAAGAALAWSWRRLPAAAHGLALGSALTFLAFFLFAKQAFCNYYYFTGVLLLAAAATAPAVAAGGEKPGEGAPS